MPSPAFQFYPDDFMGGKPGMMTPEEIGVYVLLLCLDWNQNGFGFSSKSDHERVSIWCKMRKPRLLAVWERLKDCFEERDGRMYNPRLDLERQKQREYSEAMAANGRKGGRPPKSRGKAERKPIESTPSPTPSPLTTKATTSALAVKPASWLEPYRDAWEAKCGKGSFSAVAGQCARYLKPLDAAHGPQAVAKALGQYLDRDPSRFRAISRFAANYAEYAGALPPASGTMPEIQAVSLRAKIGKLGGPQYLPADFFEGLSDDEKATWRAFGGARALCDGKHLNGSRA